MKIGGSLRDYHESQRDDKILIVATNDKRSIENNNRLKMVVGGGGGKIYEIPAIIDEGIPHTYNIYRNLGIDKVLKIAPGVVCIFRTNLLQRGLVKGMKVTIIDIHGGGGDRVDSITIREGTRQIVIRRHEFETQYDKKFVYQFPITLGYAITSHSVQGKTINGMMMVGIDLETSSSWSLIKNMFFVAMTRVEYSTQLFIDRHPAFWLFPLNPGISTLKEVKNYLYPNKDVCEKNKEEEVEEFSPPKRLKKGLEEEEEEVFTSNIFDICKKWANL